MKRKKWLIRAVWYVIQLLEELVKKQNNGSLPKALKEERPPDPPANG